MTDSSEETNNALTLLKVEQRLRQIGKREEEIISRRNMWLAHHHYKDYGTRCVKVGHRHVCRRCAALYPLGIFAALAAVTGVPFWPNSWDPFMIWLLCIPATVTYCGEAVGLFRYNPKWQVGAMLITATAFGKALHYELLERWSPAFWHPLLVFGSLWFAATMLSPFMKKKQGF